MIAFSYFPVFSHPVQAQVWGVQSRYAWKHSQYIFLHFDFLHVQSFPPGIVEVFFSYTAGFDLTWFGSIGSVFFAFRLLVVFVPLESLEFSPTFLLVVRFGVLDTLDVVLPSFASCLAFLLFAGGAEFFLILKS